MSHLIDIIMELLYLPKINTAVAHASLIGMVILSIYVLVKLIISEQGLEEGKTEEQKPFGLCKALVIIAINLAIFPTLLQYLSSVRRNITTSIAGTNLYPIPSADNMFNVYLECGMLWFCAIALLRGVVLSILRIVLPFLVWDSIHSNQKIWNMFLALYMRVFRNYIIQMTCFSGYTILYFKFGPSSMACVLLFFSIIPPPRIRDWVPPPKVIEMRDWEMEIKEDK